MTLSLSRARSPWEERRPDRARQVAAVRLAWAVAFLAAGALPARAMQTAACLPAGGPTDSRNGAADAAAPATDGVPLLPLLPPHWKTGETHAHIQLCDGLPVMTVQELYAQQLAAERQVTFAQLWGVNETISSFVAEWAPLVTGAEDPVTALDPDYVIQFGIEVSKFPAEQFGHLQCSGIANGFLPLASSDPEPIIDACLAQPGSILGYAHVLWPTSYGAPRVDPYYGGSGYLAPIDAALGRIDFIEAMSAGSDPPQYDWRGMYYKLLNAGLRPSLTSGRDNTCALAPYDEMMAARIASEPLTFAKWTAAIKAGRTTVSEGKKFLDLHVNGAAIGDSVFLDAPGPVTAQLRLTVATAHTGELRVVHDGLVQAGGQAYAIAAGQTLTDQVTVPVSESGWIAAEAEGADGADAHTAAIYVIVAGQPIVQALDAGYCADYCTELAGNLGAFDFAFPAEQDALAAHIDEAKQVFDALEAGALPLPPGVVRYGTSTPACDGPIQIGVKDLPTAGNPHFAITTVHAPPDAMGWLVVGTQPAVPPILAEGAKVFVNLGAFHLLLPILSNSGGFDAFGVAFPPASQGVTLYWQSIWETTAECAAPSGGPAAASDALAVTVQ
jgi:hypothetical protein